jgi:secondary thiamine-phosphate synthase enzyme
VEQRKMGFSKRLSLHSRAREEFIRLDAQVQAAVEESGVDEGVCYVHVPHTTAGVTLNEGADPAVAADIVARLAHLVPRDAGYAHAEGNADSHIKATLVGATAVVPVKGGRLVLGRWQSVFFCEFDGPRQRQVLLTLIEG